jgi:hypothetical protein
MVHLVTCEIRLIFLFQTSAAMLMRSRLILYFILRYVTLRYVSLIYIVAVPTDRRHANVLGSIRHDTWRRYTHIWHFTIPDEDTHIYDTSRYLTKIHKYMTLHDTWRRYTHIWHFTIPDEDTHIYDTSRYLTKMHTYMTLHDTWRRYTHIWHFTIPDEDTHIYDTSRCCSHTLLRTAIGYITILTNSVWIQNWANICSALIIFMIINKAKIILLY